MKIFKKLGTRAHRRSTIFVRSEMIEERLRDSLTSSGRFGRRTT